MAKRRWDDVVNRAIAAYRSKDYVYLYGAKNVRLTSEAQIRQFFKQEPNYYSRYSENEKLQIIRNSIGRIADDCSGFTGWVCTGDHQYSIGQINNCSKYNTLAGGPTASILFTTWGGTGRHIGLDVGGTGTGIGLSMHMGWESTDQAIAEGRAGIIFEPIGNRAWEKSGQSNCVDYTGVYSPYQPIVDLWFSLHPSPQPIPISGWVGEVYGKQLVPVYQNATGSTPLASYPALALGNLFEVTGDGGNRWQIKIANLYTGYLDKQYCLRKTPIRTGVVTTDLHLRQNAGGTYKSLAIMKQGAEVQICDVKKASNNADWYYVIYRGQYGFCSARYIK